MYSYRIDIPQIYNERDARFIVTYWPAYKLV